MSRENLVKVIKMKSTKRSITSNKNYKTLAPKAENNMLGNYPNLNVIAKSLIRSNHKNSLIRLHMFVEKKSCI